jgi:hypothetical protein
MPPATPPHCTAFDGERLLANGPLDAVTLAVRHALAEGAVGPMLVFDDHSGRLVDIDVRPLPTPPAISQGVDAPASPRSMAEGSTPRRPASRIERLAPALPRGPGRPKLGVVAREVTLLPRHWDWLAAQPSGASATLRRLVDEARRTGDGKARQRQAEEAVDRFMQAMTGNYTGHEEASRAFWRNERETFEALTAAWPSDVRDYLRQLAAVAWEQRSTVREATATPSAHKPRG